MESGSLGCWRRFWKSRQVVHDGWTGGVIGTTEWWPRTSRKPPDPLWYRTYDVWVPFHCTTCIIYSGESWGESWGVGRSEVSYFVERGECQSIKHPEMVSRLKGPRERAKCKILASFTISRFSTVILARCDVRGTMEEILISTLLLYTRGSLEGCGFAWGSSA